MITAQIKLDTFRENNIPILKIPQGDYLGRVLKVFITALGERIKLSTSDAVTVTALRSDGASKNFTGMVDASDGSALIPIERWMLDVEGDVECWVSVLRGDSKYSTNRFLIEVQYSPGAETSGELDLTPEDQVVVEINAKIDALDSALNALAFDLRVTNSNMNYADEELNAKINSASEKITDVENDLAVHELKTGAKISALEEKEEADYRANRLISMEIIRPYANSDRALVLKKEDLDQVFSLVTFPVYENGTEFIKGRVPMFLKWYDVEEAAFRSYDLKQSYKVSRGYDNTNEYYSIKFLYGDAVLYDGPGYDFYFAEHSNTKFLQPVVVDEYGNYMSGLNVVGSSLYSGVFDTDNLPSALSVNTADVYRYTYADGNYRDFMLVPEGRTELAQEPGDSETKVMSQKAVTELCKDTVKNKTIFEYYQKNYLDPDKKQIGYLDTSGNVTIGGDYDNYEYYEEYVPVKKGDIISTQYTLTTYDTRFDTKAGNGPQFRSLVVYDKNREVIVPSDSATQNYVHTLAVPMGGAYVSFCFSTNTIHGGSYKDITILKNSTDVLPYFAYDEPKCMLKEDIIPPSTVPHIGENKNWFIGDTDTGIKAEGTDGEDGKDGADGKDGVNGAVGKDGTNGKDGITPHIGENGNWWIGDEDTGVNASDGSSAPSPMGIDPRASIRQIICYDEEEQKDVVFEDVYQAFNVDSKMPGFVYGLEAHKSTSATQTVYVSRDGGETWRSYAEFDIDAPNNVWYGQIFVDEFRKCIYLLKTTDGHTRGNNYLCSFCWNGESWYEVNSIALGPKRWLSNYNSIDVATSLDWSERAVIFGEYGVTTDGSTYAIRKTIDNGATWTTVLELGGNSDGQPFTGPIRHWHTIQCDPYTKHWWATSGDGDATADNPEGQCRIYRSTDMGETWELIFSGSQRERLCNFVFEENYIYYGMDSTNHADEKSIKLIKIDKSKLETEADRAEAREDVATIDSAFAVWGISKVYMPEGILIWSQQEQNASFVKDRYIIQFYDYATKKMYAVARFDTSKIDATKESIGFFAGARVQNFKSGTIFAKPLPQFFLSPLGGGSELSTHIKVNITY